MDVSKDPSEEDMTGGGWRWEAEFHGWVHTATLAVVTVLVLFVLVMGSFGNGLVLLSAARRRRCRRRRRPLPGKGAGSFDLLLLHLCCADLLQCVLLAPLYLYTLFADPPAPRVFCGGVLLLGTGLALLSLLSLVAIAVHRQSRVAPGRVAGSRQSLSRRHTRLVLGVVWVVSGVGAVGAAVPAVVGWRESYASCQVLVLSHDDPLMRRFTPFFLGPVVVVSFAVIIFSYVVIARAVRAQSRARVRGLMTAAFSSASSVYRGTDLTQHSHFTLVPRKKKEKQKKSKTANLHSAGGSADAARRRGKKSLRPCRCCGCRSAAERDSKAVTMCVVVMVSLVLCWSPLLLSVVLEAVAGPSVVLLQVRLCGIALVFLNSALDPYLYAAHTQGRAARSRFGRLCWDVLHCQCTTSTTTRTITSFRTAAAAAAAARGTRTAIPAALQSSFLEVEVPATPLIPANNTLPSPANTGLPAKDVTGTGKMNTTDALTVLKDGLNRAGKEKSRRPTTATTTTTAATVTFPSTATPRTSPGSSRSQKWERSGGPKGVVYKPLPVLCDSTWHTLFRQQTLTTTTTTTTTTPDTVPPTDRHVPQAATSRTVVVHGKCHRHHRHHHHACWGTADVMPDVTTVGHKSWCRVHVSSDRSLMES